MDGAMEKYCMCVNVYMVCVNVINKQPIGKSLKDEGSLQIYYT